MTPFTPRFKEKYYDKLLKPNGNNPVRNRADSLLLVFEYLDKLDKSFYNILETGCMRPDHGELCFGDDGCSSIIFDDFIKCKSGVFTSVDINPINVAYTRNKLPQVNSVCQNSVSFLYNLPTDLNFDLIYLDSYDIEQANPHPSQLHHIKELTAVLKNTKKGTLIVVDDHDAFFTEGKIGKGNYVKDFMLDIGAKILYEGYQIVFEL